MSTDLVKASLDLDFGMLFVIAIWVTSLLGLFLLFAWIQERIPALAWWGAAYLLGALSGVLWRFSDVLAPFVSSDLASALLFVAVGMIWSAARLFHGRPVQWGPMCFGAGVWLVASMFPAFAQSAGSRLLVGSLIVACYTFLTATELWGERRRTLIRRWPAIFVPILHGAIFLYPVVQATLAPAEGPHGPATSWINLYVIEVVLYVVGAAFIVLILAKDRTVRFYKVAATTDALTGVLNRRGFFEAAQAVMERNRGRKAPVSVLALDLDHFKSINDSFGHAGGDAVLTLFAAVARRTLRLNDVVGRLGGEEFVALLPSTLADAAVAAERVRAAFVTAAANEGQKIPATVSIGVACGSPLAAIETLITRADAALYRAKSNGRNRVERDEEAVPAAPQDPDAKGAPPQTAGGLIASRGAA
jgi:diguanylate cyclase (GGDEF)-like protein